MMLPSAAPAFAAMAKGSRWRLSKAKQPSGPAAVSGYVGSGNCFGAKCAATSNRSDWKSKSV